MIPGFDLATFVAATLAEDMGDAGDITAAAVIPADAVFTGVMDSRDAITVAGLDIAAAFFRHLDPAVAIEPLVADGDRVVAGTALLRLRGRARALLTAERSALNTVQHLSGIATLTATYVAAIAGTGATLLDTRKTIPGLRILEKYATRMGGATNHRMGLWDAAMIKDNHVAVAGSVGAATARAKAAGIDRIIVEVDLARPDRTGAGGGRHPSAARQHGAADARPGRRDDRRTRAGGGIGRGPPRHDPRHRRNRRHLCQRRPSYPIGARRRYRAGFHARRRGRGGITTDSATWGNAMRPSSIVRFDRLYLASIAIGLIGNILEWPITMARLAENPDTAALGSGAAVAAGGMIVIGVAIALLLWFFIARRASVVAKWILVVFTAFSVGSLLLGFSSGAVILDTGGIVRIVAVALQAAAVFFLFHPDAAAWFAPAVLEEDA